MSNTAPEVPPYACIRICVMGDALKPLPLLDRWVKLIDAPTIVRVPPEAVKVTITIKLELIRKHYGAPVGLSNDLTRKALAAAAFFRVTKLTQEEQFVNGILTKPIKLPLVNVKVKVNAFSKTIIPKMPIPN